PASADLWAVINGSRMLTALKAPGALDTRWLSEDVPYGLATWALLGDALGVDTPTIDALVTLASAVVRTDFRASAPGLDAAGMLAVARG
ncbi:MAG TPA: NAD/NADP octopine/nopaline dehydrogenase family protein, partial [Thermomicrobiales bacterium]|nr:NAD/NADP octopine/nopaline dehydrogenase family protein [Thermomicrobiales bacterium]